MNVLVVSQHFWPESFRINDVARDLAVEGASVIVLTGQPNYPEGDIYPGYRAYGWGESAFTRGVTIQRVPLAPRGKGSALRLAANYLSFIAFATLLGPWLLRRRRIDVVFVYGTSPILQAIPAILLARVKRAKLVIWVQDLWPESLQVTGFVRNKLLLSMVRSVVSWCYRRADLLLVQSPAFVAPVQARAGQTPVRYHPNPGDDFLAAGGGSHQQAVQVPLPDGFCVVFAGNLGTAQGLEVVLDAAQLLSAQPQIKIVLVGAGSRAQWVADEIARRGLGNMRLPGKFPAQSMQDLFRRSSVLLMTLAPGEILSMTIPSKLQSYLASGRPIVVSADGEGARVVRESGAGLACPAGDAVALAAAITEIHACGSEVRGRMGEAGTRYFAQHFEPRSLARQLKQALRALTDNRDTPGRPGRSKEKS